MRVLILDRSNPVFVQWARGLAREIADLGVELIFFSDKEPSSKTAHFEVVNINDIPQSLDLETLENRLGFSIIRALATERSFFDYSSLRRCQTYSNLDLLQIGRTITPYLNAFDYLVREKVDLVLEGLADNFMTSLVGRVAGFYAKPFYMAYSLYWWADGLLFVNQIDQTSSEIEERYRHLMAHPGEIDHARVDQVYAQKKTTWQFSDSKVYPLRRRLSQLFARARSYEPISWRNWICRRIGWAISRVAIKALIKRYIEPLDEDFVLFPLHVSPEATLLGSIAEQADQLSLIKNISMNLPFGVRLYVKEHPAQQLGLGLDYSFYRRLTSLPNVRYFRADAPLDSLLHHPRCRAIAVISGTVGLEAAMRRRPVFVFGRAPYGVADCFIKPADFSEFYQSLQRIRRGEFEFDESALYAYLQALDETVVHADIDVTQSKSWSDFTVSSLPVYRAFFCRRLEARASAAAEAGNANG